MLAISRPPARLSFHICQITNSALTSPTHKKCSFTKGVFSQNGKTAERNLRDAGALFVLDQEEAMEATNLLVSDTGQGAQLRQACLLRMRRLSHLLP